jgi:hypothetical protein
LSDEPAAEGQDSVLGPLVRVIEEACDSAPWALIGGTALRLQGVQTHSPNLEFMASSEVVTALASMLGQETEWDRGQHLAATRLQFLRHGIPVFVFADPVFHGRYESLKPMEIPSLWDARIRATLGAPGAPGITAAPGITGAPGVTGTVGIPTTPAEWELLLAVILEAHDRVELLRHHLRSTGFDSRLIVRLLREGHVDRETEEAVWSVLERDA